MEIKNKQTQEIIEVHNTRMIDGRIVGRFDFGVKFFNRYPMMTKVGVEDGKAILELSDEWEIISKTRGTKANTQPNSGNNNTDNNTNNMQQEQTTQQTQTQQAMPQTNDITAAFAALTPLFSGVQANVLNAVMEQLQPTIEKLTQAAQTQVKRIEVVTDKGEARKVDGVTCEAYDEMLQYLADGQPVYMYGAAGCGKSHTAQQLADGLGLPLYSQSQVLFAHDVKGYGDAGGNYQHTPFYKAFTEGGLFFIDEMDASAPEALVVLNTAIANGHYDFPIIGNVKAHENFRVIAAGNTAMTGADSEYTARFVQDASSRNRFAFFKMEYDKRVELPVMACGDTELMDFVCDLRQAIKNTGVSLCVSYRQTKILANKNITKFGKNKALLRNVFGGMEQDEIRIIWQALNEKTNVWAKAMEKLIK